MQRLKNNLIELSKIGYEEGKGITRKAYSSNYKESEEYLINLMKASNLDIRKDSVGNIFGVLKGNKEKGKSIIIGSHIDTVPNGGMYDGSIGVLGALECLITMKELNYKNNFNIEIASFIGEEGTPIGGTFGSRCFSGQINIEKNQYKELEKIGLTIEDISKAKCNLEKIKSYLELHIEQSSVLFTKKKTIGIVKGITGISRYKGIVRGSVNHAGTTPMNNRDDALVKTSRIILKINEIAKDFGPPLVATVGYINTEPGAVNVIPGKAEFPLEVRDIFQKRIDDFIKELKNECNKLELELKEHEIKESAFMDKKIQETIHKVTKNLKYSFEFIYSGASHDASPISKITPSGMIFIPSKNGISHSPEEFSEWEDIEAGTNVLLKTILEIDKE